MRISTKGRYALRLMLDLAEHQGDGCVSLKDVAQRQDISKKYLEQIVPTLSRAGFLLTNRGYQGGYRLARRPEDYTARDILRLTEGSLAPVACLDCEVNTCPRSANCPTLPLWQGLDRVIEDYLAGVTLQDLIDRLNLVSREILTGIPVIRAFSREKHEEERFEEANQRLTKTNLFVNRTMTFMMPLMMLIMNGISVLIIYTGAHSIDAGNMQVGDMMAFIQYAMQIIMSFLMITMMSIMLPRAGVAANRILEVLDTPLSIEDPENCVKPEEKEKGTVVFDHVSFAYPGAEEEVLSDITFEARKGETVAFIGSTGSGKSTLVNLIPRFFDVTKGSVRVDGVDIRQMKLGDLRERIGYVPQKGVLFSGTIDSNLRYGREHATREELEKAAAMLRQQSLSSRKKKVWKARSHREEAMCPVVRNRGCRLQEPLQNSRKSIFLMTVFLRWTLRQMRHFEKH